MAAHTTHQTAGADVNLSYTAAFWLNEFYNIEPLGNELRRRIQEKSYLVCNLVVKAHPGYTNSSRSRARAIIVHYALFRGVNDFEAGAKEILATLTGLEKEIEAAVLQRDLLQIKEPEEEE